MKDGEMKNKKGDPNEKAPAAHYSIIRTDKIRQRQPD